MLPRPCQEIICTLAWRGKKQRATSEHGSKQNLQSTVAPDVIECCPHEGAGETPGGLDRSTQGRERVDDHLRHTRRARGEKNPLGRMLCFALECDGAKSLLDRNDALDAQSAQGLEQSIRDNRIDLR